MFQNDKILPPPPAQLTELTEKTKSYVQKVQASPNYTFIRNNTYAGILKAPKAIQWDKLKYYQQENISITPVEITGNNVTYKGNSILITMYDDKLNVKYAFFADLLSSKKEYLQQGQFNLDLLKLKNLSSSFDGSIIMTDLNNNKIGSRHIKNGKLSNTGDNYSYKEATLAMPPAPGSAGCQDIVIDWYWVQYDEETGMVLSETYLYSTTNEYCSNSGGGSNDGSGNIKNEIQYHSYPTSSGDTQIPIADDEMGDINKGVNWAFHRVFVPNFFGIHVDKYYFSGETVALQNNYGDLRIKSISHNNIVDVGSAFPVSPQINLLNAIPNVINTPIPSFDLAIMNLDYTVSYSISGSYTINFDFNHSSVYYACHAWTVKTLFQ